MIPAPAVAAKNTKSAAVKDNPLQNHSTKFLDLRGPQKDKSLAMIFLNHCKAFLLLKK